MLLYQMYVLHEGRARLTELIELDQVHSDMDMTCSFEEFKDSIAKFIWDNSSYDHFIQCYTEYDLEGDEPYVLLIFRVDTQRANLALHYQKVQELIDINTRLFENFTTEVRGHGSNTTLH